MTHERILYLDWLKILIVYGIVVFHVCLVFSLGAWLVTNSDRSLVLSAFAGFCFPWGIPAMFLIAGADAWFGLRSRSASTFLWDRGRRLLIPFVVGFVVLSPFQWFLVSHNPPPSIERLGSFYVAFFRSFRLDSAPQWVSSNWMHLWFLAYLFAISVACTPLLLWLRSDSGREWTGHLARVTNRPGGAFLLGMPILVSQAALRPIFPTYQGWADVATYTCAFLSGALIFSTRRFEPVIRRSIGWLLSTGVIAIGGIGLILVLSPGHLPPAGGGRLALSVGYGILWGLDVWCWMLALLYLGIRWLNMSNRALVYARESVLPVYVIHHPVVLLLASFVVATSLGVWPKFAIILVGAFALTLGIYEFGVRRWRMVRFMFGLKAQRHPERSLFGAVQSLFGEPTNRKTIAS